MTHTPQDQKTQAHTRAVAQYATEARRAMGLAHAAIDQFDAAAAIARLRSLKSSLWRAERAGVGLADIAAELAAGKGLRRESLGTRRGA